MTNSLFAYFRQPALHGDYILIPDPAAMGSWRVIDVRDFSERTVKVFE